jgi:hypothetical protein
MKELSPEEWARKTRRPDIELSEEECTDGVYVAAGNTEAGRASLLKIWRAGLATEGYDALLHVENLDKALEALDGVFVLVRRYEKRFYGPTTN